MRGIEKNRDNRILVSISSELNITRIVEDFGNTFDRERIIRPVQYGFSLNQSGEVLISTEKKKLNSLKERVQAIDKEAKIIIL